MSIDAVVEQFVANAQIAAAETATVNSVEQLNEVLGRLLKDVEGVFCPRVTEWENAVELDEDKLSDDIRFAAVCVEEVDAGIAETGSIVSTSRNRRVVQAGLLPSHHVALVNREHIFAGIDEFFDSLSTNPPVNVTVETGPSRTADIELTLTIGVHGPERLTIIVF